MASFGCEIDLMGMVGAQYAIIKDEKTGKNVPCVCIPVAWNEMNCWQDNKQKQHAGVKINMWPVSKGIADWWKQKRITAGEQITMYNIPTHRIELNLSDEYRQKLAVRAKQVLLEQHKDDWTMPEQQNEATNKELHDQIYSMTHFDLCSSVWMRQPKNQPTGAPMPQAAAAPTATATAWRPNFDADGNMAGGAAAPDDLPF